jgi:pyruvate dehydrogenase E2 component (dihydrolipoamide acetyltransferase)
MAQEHNLDLAAIPGRGPGGRVVREDVEAAIAAAQAAPAPALAVPTPAEAEVPAPQPVAAGVNERPLTRIQLTAARRLAESKQQAPHFYLTIEVDMAEAMRLRKTLNEQAEGQLKISVNDLVVKACAHALTRHPNLNCSYRDGKVLLYDRINVSVAIDTEEGLVSPVIPDADKKSLGQIARESRALIERARAKRLRPEDYADGTFTVSNLGMLDIDTFVAIINPPQAAILAVGAVRQIPVVRDGQLSIGEIMKVTLSADHRATDGAAGARFLADLRRALEKPLLMAL